VALAHRRFTPDSHSLFCLIIGLFLRDPHFRPKTALCFQLEDWTIEWNNTSRNSVRSVDLDLTLHFTTPGSIANQVFKYRFNLEVTPNSTGNAVLDADILTFPIGVPTRTFTVSGRVFTLQLIGFSQDNGLTIIEQFKLPEGQSTWALLYAKITTPPPPTPTPIPATPVPSNSPPVAARIQQARSKTLLSLLIFWLMTRILTGYSERGLCAKRVWSRDY